MRAGSRSSKLAKAQTAFALRFLKEDAGIESRAVWFKTPGDRDLKTPIERSAPDFFTRDLDDAVRAGKIDFAVHSAKDLPVPMPEDLDWFWLPLHEDRRDCWVWNRAAHESATRNSPVRIGVSSDRRSKFAKRKFPKARLLPIRGAIDSRIAQVAGGDFDAVLMAMAGLKRLYGERWPLLRQGYGGQAGNGVDVVPIPIEELDPPEAQGVLAVVFRKGNPEMQKLRSRYVKAVRFVSGGIGDAELITVRGQKDLAAADVILYDDLTGFDPAAFANPGARLVHVGKRCGHHSMKQPEITKLICDEVRKGLRVVRLKGGDAGLFGRLTEETDALAELGIPFLVRPGVSALTAATTPNGLLLTRRGEAKGFSVLTPRSAKGEAAVLPPHGDNIVMFMATKVLEDEAKKLVASGYPKSTPVAIVYGAATPNESIVRGTLADFSSHSPLALRSLGEGGFPVPRLPSVALAKEGSPLPGLVIVGPAAAKMFPVRPRILITCSEAVYERAAIHFEDRGMKPIRWPLIELVPCFDSLEPIPRLYRAFVFTSPSAVRIFFKVFTGDIRKLPQIYTCGAGTDAELRLHGVRSDLMPKEDFSAKGLIAEIRKLNLKGRRVIRFCSELAGDAVANALAERGAEVDDVVLYENAMVENGPLPEFEEVFFASASAVKSFLLQYGEGALKGRKVRVMGKPTLAALPKSLARRAVVDPIVTA